MSYITVESVTVQRSICAHPKVKYAWDYGYLSLNPGVGNCGYAIALILDNETEDRHDFKAEKPQDAIDKAEEFLATL